MAELFDPLDLGGLVLPNRLVVAPMCQYSAISGFPTEWHTGHLQRLAVSGAGMLMLESTAVTLDGRISKNDLAISSDRHGAELGQLLDSIRSVSEVAVGLQISHAGRKGSVHVPWENKGRFLESTEGAWETVSASPERRDFDWPIPRELDVSGIANLIENFESASMRACKSGFDGLEIHMAHGYLLHQFLSPVSNKRKDAFGGSFSNRCRLPLEIVSKVRKVWPKNRILGVRVTGDDWLDGGWTADDCVRLVRELKMLEVDYVCVSSGGILPITGLQLGSGYQVHLAEQVKKATNVITRTAGMIKSPYQANTIIRNSRADLVAIGRQLIEEPWFVARSARELGRTPVIPKQYERCFSNVVEGET